MKNREDAKRVILFFAAAVIIVIEAVIFEHICFTYYRPILFWKRWQNGNLLMVCLYAVIIYFFSRVYGALKIGHHRLTDVIYSQALTVLFTNAVSYVQLCLMGRHIMEFHPIIIMTAMDMLAVVIWACGSRWIYGKLYSARRMLLIYGEYDPDDLLTKINSRKDKYRILDKICISEDPEKIKKMILNYEAVVICDLPAQQRNDLIKYCFAKSVRAYVTPKISDVIMRGADTMHSFDTPLLVMRNNGLSFEQRVGKRIVDLVLTIPMCIVASPFMLLIAILIKAYDGGPVLYRQRRLTLDGREFMIYKFRSMCVDSEKGGARLARKNDNRITPVGKVLRNLHLDELPQVLNILKGEMSLVGPRPERPEIAAEYYREIPEFAFRLRVKAGLTGYAQIYGKYNTTPYDKLKLDMYYIENYSLWRDIRIILMTIKILFVKENTEGVDDSQVTAMKSRGEGK